MRDRQGFTDFASARAGDLRRQAYLLTGSPERAARLADKALAETGRRWDKLGGGVAAEEHARRVLAAGALRGRGVAPAVSLTSRGTAAPTDDVGEAVWRALAGLPPRRRAVLVLRYDEGLDDAAVGARLGVPSATAAAEGEAGLATLRSLLRRRGRPEDLLPVALATAGSTQPAGGPTSSSGLPMPAPPAGPAARASSTGTPSSADAGTAGDRLRSPDDAPRFGRDPGSGGSAAGAAAALAGTPDRAAAVRRPADRDAAGGGAADRDAAAGGAADRDAAAGGAADREGRDAVETVDGEDRDAAGPGAARGRRRGWVVAAVVVAVVGIGAGVLVPALRGDSTADGPVPASSGTAPAQLPWPVRGPLAGDQDLLRSALRAWQGGVPDRQRPVRSAALWAGDLDGVRTVLLQGTDATGQSWVASVLGSGDTASLRSTEPLGRAVPLLALGTSAGAVRLLADPQAAPDSIAALVGGTLRPLAVAHDGLTQAVTAPSAGLRVVLTDGGAVMGSGTVLPGRVSPVTGTVELTRETLDLGPTQPPTQTWYDDGELIARRLGGPVELVEVGPVRATSVRVGGRPARTEARAYEVIRGGTRYLATVVRAGGAPACTDTATVGPADSVPGAPVALVARCIPRGAADGMLAAVGTRSVRSVVVTLAPATPAVPGRPGTPGRRGSPARTVTISGPSGAGLFGLAVVRVLPTRALPVVVRDSANRPLARLTLPAYRGARP